MEKGKLDPFLVDVEEAVRIVGKYFSRWVRVEDHCLDARSVERISAVTKAQSDRIKDYASRLFVDPTLVEQKIQELGKEDLAVVFLKAWRPVVYVEQLTLKDLEEGIDYWRELPPFSYARREFERAREPELLDEERLAALGLVGEGFDNKLSAIYKELKKAGEVDYVDFVLKDRERAGERAYLLSCLITYGYAELLFERGAFRVRALEERKSWEKPQSVAVAFRLERGQA